MNWTNRTIAAALLCLGFVTLLPTPAHAQHSDYLLGTNSLLSGQQPPEGIYYFNVWSYYHASGSDFLQASLTKCGPIFHKACGTANLSAGARGTLDSFVDQNIIGWTTPLTFLGAHYGLLVDVPFAIANASGNATLEPSLATRRFTLTPPGPQKSGGSTKGSIANMLIQPLIIGWHFKHLDAVISSGFFAPAGPYNSKEAFNIGFGHWSGLFGLGGIFYPDAERTWSASIYAHYLLYGSQMGRNYTLGDVVPFEWGLGKTINLNSQLFSQLTIGPVGYAQWQVAGNHIGFTPTTPLQSAAVNKLEDIRSQIYAAGPALQLLTKYGLFSLRWYEEFGAHATPSGQQLMFSFALACDPGCLHGLLK